MSLLWCTKHDFWQKWASTPAGARSDLKESFSKSDAWWTLCFLRQSDVVHREERGQTRSAGAARDSGAGTGQEPLPLQRAAQVLRGKHHVKHVICVRGLFCNLLQRFHPDSFPLLDWKYNTIQFCHQHITWILTDICFAHLCSLCLLSFFTCRLKFFWAWIICGEKRCFCTTMVHSPFWCLLLLFLFIFLFGRSWQLGITVNQSKCLFTRKSWCADDCCNSICCH